MTKFVQSRCGYVNLAHVASLERQGNDDYRAYSAKGDLIGTVSAHDVGEIDYAPDAIVPDRTGAVLVGIWHDGDGSWIYRHPIIAWKVGRFWSEPVCIDELPDTCTNGFWVIELPETYGSSRWVRPGDRHFDNFDAVMAEARESYEKAQAAPAAARGPDA